MKIIQGNLIQLAKTGHFDVIVHGCNCFRTMGAGIAKHIKKEFPEAYQADYKNKLGTISHAEIDRDGINLIVVNGYTQFSYGSRGVLVNYDALESVFSSVKQNFSGKKIGYPKIGAGLAGGNWNRIAEIIE